MKHVTFSGSMAPYLKGEKRLLPDGLAAELEAQGALSHSEDWPPRQATAAAPPAPRTTPHPARAIGARDKRSARP